MSLHLLLPVKISICFSWGKTLFCLKLWRSPSSRHRECTQSNPLTTLTLCGRHSSWSQIPPRTPRCPHGSALTRCSSWRFSPSRRSTRVWLARLCTTGYSTGSRSCNSFGTHQGTHARDLQEEKEKRLRENDQAQANLHSPSHWRDQGYRLAVCGTIV